MSDKDEPPWRRGVAGVKGVTPPGRRLGKPGDRRPNRWSATGVAGVTPPGAQSPGTGPATDWVLKKDKAARALQKKQNQRAFDDAKRAAAKPEAPAAPPSFDPLRPGAGFAPDVFADVGDPGDLKAFLQNVNDFLAEHRPHPQCADHFNQLITQSHAPFEIVVGFTILSAVVGRSSELRRKFALSLERGAKVFFNLARRLDPDVRPPRGLVPETVDALFYDLPATAMQIPYAFTTHAFLHQMTLLRGPDDPEYDEALVSFGESLWSRFIQGRAYGDTGLDAMFPWETPEWAPADD